MAIFVYLNLFLFLINPVLSIDNCAPGDEDCKAGKDFHSEDYDDEHAKAKYTTKGR